MMHVQHTIIKYKESFSIHELINIGLVLLREKLIDGQRKKKKIVSIIYTNATLSKYLREHRKTGSYGKASVPHKTEKFLGSEKGGHMSKYSR